MHLHFSVKYNKGCETEREVISTIIALRIATVYVTEFAKRGLIHASDFPTLTKHNFICKQAIKLKFSVLLAQ